MFHGDRSSPYGFVMLEKSRASFITGKYAKRPLVMIWSLLDELAGPNQSSSKNLLSYLIQSWVFHNELVIQGGGIQGVQKGSKMNWTNGVGKLLTDQELETELMDNGWCGGVDEAHHRIS